MRSASPVSRLPDFAGIDAASEPRLDRLADGALLLVRDADRGDRAAILSLGATCLDALVRPHRLRGGTVGPVRRMLAIAEGRSLDGVTLAALDPRNGRVLGIGSFLLAGDGGDVAPAWVLVSPSHRSRGIATALLERLAELGRDRAIARFTADVRAADRRMLELVERVGGERVPASRPYDGVLAISVPLTDDESLGVPLSAALWAIARHDLTPVLFDDADAR